MFGKIVLTLAALTLVRAQIPSLGWCPEYVPMANFDMNRFLGVWYEAERYFQLSEVVSRCVMANYTRGADGKLRVSNEVTNRFTGIKRVLEGEIKPAASKTEEGKLHVKYTTVPLTPETKYSVLETDYDNYAVMWSCSGIGPLSAQNAWVMTRMRLAPGEILQKAYGVLDKYKISKAFFVKTDQDDCAYIVPLPQMEEAAPVADTGNVRSAIATEKEEDPEPAINDSPIRDAVEEPALESEPAKEVAVDSVPERILAVANAAKLEQNAEEEKGAVPEKIENVETVEEPVEEKAPKRLAGR